MHKFKGTTEILYGKICNCLDAVRTPPTETAFCCANRLKDFQEEFSNQ
jgi:hypothetical protein